MMKHFILFSILIFSQNVGANCELPVQGNYIQQPKNHVEEFEQEPISFQAVQKNCEVKITQVGFDLSQPNPKITKIYKNVWKIDLKGDRAMVIPQEFLQDVPVQSLRVITKQLSNGSIELKAYFTVSHSGFSTRMLAEGLYVFQNDRLMFKYSHRVFNGRMFLLEPGIKLSVIADNIFMRTSANWLLKLFGSQINSFLGQYGEQSWLKL